MDPTENLYIIGYRNTEPTFISVYPTHHDLLTTVDYDAEQIYFAIISTPKHINFDSHIPTSSSSARVRVALGYPRATRDNHYESGSAILCIFSRSESSTSDSRESLEAVLSEWGGVDASMPLRNSPTYATNSSPKTLFISSQARHESFEPPK